jgi:hypothetical protein
VAGDAGTKETGWEKATPVLKKIKRIAAEAKMKSFS